MAEHVNYDKTINSYGSQNERFDKEGQNQYLYNFSNPADPRTVLPTMDGMNVYSAYIRKYIDKKDNDLLKNIRTNQASINKLNSKINKLQQEIETEDNIFGDYPISLLTSQFSQDYAEVNDEVIAIPVIPEYFQEVSDADTIFAKPTETEWENFITYIENNGSIEMGSEIVELGYNKSRLRFLAYLYYCHLYNNSTFQRHNPYYTSNNNDPDPPETTEEFWNQYWTYSSNGTDRLNTLLKFTDSNKTPSGQKFIHFFPSPFMYLLPNFMKENYNKPILFFDPNTKNLYQTVRSINSLYLYSLGYTNDQNNLPTGETGLWYKIGWNNIKNNSHFVNIYQNLKGWVTAGGNSVLNSNNQAAKDAYNYYIEEMTKGLFEVFDSNSDNPTFETKQDGIYNVTSSSIIATKNNAAVRNFNYYNNYMYFPGESNAIFTYGNAEELKNKYPFGAMIVYCQKIGTLSGNGIIWTTSNKEAEENPYQYNENNLTQLISSSWYNKDQNYPVPNDYIYNQTSSELVKVSNRNEGIVYTVPIQRSILYTFESNGVTETLYENTYLKGANLFALPSNTILIGDNDDSSIYEVEPSKFFSNVILSETESENFNFYHRSIKETDIVICNNYIYQVIKRVYERNSNYYILLRRIDQLVDNISVDLSDYYTKGQANSKFAQTDELPQLINTALQNNISTVVQSEIANLDLSDTYTTKSYANNTYATISDVSNNYYNKTTSDNKYATKLNVQNLETEISNIRSTIIPIEITNNLNLYRGILSSQIISLPNNYSKQSITFKDTTTALINVEAGNRKEETTIENKLQLSSIYHYSEVWMENYNLPFLFKYEENSGGRTIIHFVYGINGGSSVNTIVDDQTTYRFRVPEIYADLVENGNSYLYYRANSNSNSSHF